MSDFVGVSTGWGDVVSLAKEADRTLDSMVRKSEEISRNLRNAFSQQGQGGFYDLINKAQGGLIEALDFKSENANASKLLETFYNLSEIISKMAGENKELFDPTRIYESTKGIGKLEEELLSIQNTIRNLKSDYMSLSGVQKVLSDKKSNEDSITEARKEALEIFAKRGLEISEKASNEEIIIQAKIEQAKIDSLRKILKEQERIAAETLRYNGATAAEQQKMIENKNNAIIRDEKRAAKEVRDAQKERYSTPEGAIAFSNAAKTEEQEEQAIKYLIEARKKLSYEDKKYIEIRDELNKRIEKHRISVEQATKAEQNEQTLQPKIANEYARILVEIDKLTAKKKELANTSTLRSGNKEASDDYNALQQRLNDLNDRRFEIEESAQGQLDEIYRKHEANRAVESVNAIVKSEQEKAKKMEEFAKKYATITSTDALASVTQSKNTQNIAQAEKAIQDLKIARDKLDNTDSQYAQTVAALNEEIKRQEEYIESVTKAEEHQKKQEEEYNRTREGAMAYAEKAKSVGELKKAIDYLQSAMDKEDISTKEGKKNYREMSEELNNLKERYSEVTGESKKFTDITEIVGSKLKAIFSVAAIRGYVNEIIKVRKEFELQNRALQAIIQNADKANQIWDKTVALAVQSPFTVKQLVTYTKQLAAYRIESDKLYDTTKMLADVSAGLGVDMDRLILAYGQVRAASYLRGTELRQFTEAGIPMLDELAKRFTELEGRAVSVGDVFTRISKRMVSFNDVAEVFNNLTQEGGTFYRMQEIQAETLYGQLSNLRDAIDIMFNEIGKANDGVLKNLVAALRSIINNYREWIALIKIVGISVGVSVIKSFGRGAISVMKYGTRTMAVMHGMTAAGGKTITMFQTLWKTIAKNPFLAVAGAATALTTVILNHIKAVNSANKKYDELSIRENNQITNYRKIADEIDKNNKLIEENRDAAENDAEAKERLVKAQEGNKIALEELNKLYPKTATLIEQQEDGILNYNEALEEENRLLSINIALQQGGKADFFHNDFIKNYQDATEALSKYNNAYESLKNAARASMVQVQYSFKQGKLSVDDYNKSVDALITIINSSKEDLISMGDSILQSGGLSYAVTSDTKKAYDTFVKFQNRFTNRLDDLTWNIKQQVPMWSEGIAEFDLNGEQGKKDAASWVNSQLDALGVVDGEIKKWAQQEIEQRVNVRLIWAPADNGDAELEGWKKSYDEKFKKDSVRYNRYLLENPETQQADVIKELNDMYKERLDLLEKIEKAGEGATEVGGAYEGENIENIKKETKELKNQLLWFGVDPDATNAAKSQADWIAKMISLVKDMNKSYEDLNKTFDNTTSEMNTMTSFEDAFKEIFKDTDISLFKTSIDRDKLNELIKEGHKAGSVFSDAMLEEMEKMAESGSVIRSASDDFIKKIMSNEGFRASLYDDSTGVLIKNAEDFSKKVGTATIGIGHAISNLKEAQKYFGKELSEDEAFELLKSDIEIAEKALNKYLDKYQELVLTQEQYDALLDKTYQGGGGFIKKALEYASDTDSALSFFDTLSVKLNNAGKNFSEEFGEDFIDNFKEANSIAERLAMVIETMNLTTKASGSNIDKNLYEGMKRRAKEMADLFRGDIDFSNMLSQAIVKSSNLDITTPEGVAAFLEKLLPYAKTLGSKYVQELQKAIADYKVEIGITAKQDSDKDIKKQVEDMFDQYDLTLELKELDIPQDLAKNLFKVDYTSLDDLRGKLVSMRESFIGKDMLDEYDKFMEKLNDMEIKAAKERMKTYSKYLYEGMSERVKITVDGLKKIKEVEESSEFDEYQKKRIKEGISKETRAELQKQQWEEFKNTDIYTMMFDDIENMGTTALTALRDRLKELKYSLKDLPTAELRRMATQLSKIEEEIAVRNPFKALADSMRKIKELKNMGLTEDVLQAQFVQSESLKASYQEELDNVNLIISRYDDKVALQQLSRNEEGKYAKYLGMSKEELEEMSSTLSGNIVIQDDILDRLLRQLGIYSDAERNADAVEKTWNNILSLTKKAYSSISDILDTVDADAYGISQEVVDTTFSLAEGVMQMVSLSRQIAAGTEMVKIFGVEMKVALGPLGYILIALEVVARVLKAIFSIKSKNIQKQLDQQERSIERLQRSYENLEEAIDKAWSTDQMVDYYDQMKKNIELQIQSTKSAIAALSTDKKSSKVGTDEWKQLQDLLQQLNDLQKKLEEVDEQSFDTFTDGVMSNVMDASKSWTESWLDAFSETGDGLDGLEDNFEEMLKNIATKQAAMMITGQYVERWKEALSNFTDDGKLSPSEIEQWAKGVRDDFPELNDALKAYFEAIKGVIGGGNNLSGLTKGIQGMTEEQADILAAYWNSVRQYTASIDEKISSIIPGLNFNDEANPMISQLKIIASQTNSIYELLDGLTASYPNGGRGFKIVMSD